MQGGKIMENKVNMMERLAGLVIGSGFMIIGLLLTVLGVSFLPVIGVIIAIPVMGMSLYFFRPQVQFATTGEKVLALEPRKEKEKDEEVEVQLDEAA
jgi:hypothetical protein